MTMRGIDISNWQAGISLDAIDCDFVLIKATEDLSFVDPYCDGFVQDCIRLGRKWGVYHFARVGNPREQARFFIENCRGYVGEGVLALDMEDFAIDSWGNFADDFCDEVKRLTGVNPMIYTSANELERFRGSNVTRDCGLWLARYPYPTTVWPDPDCPYSADPWEFVAIWQFTDCLAAYGYRIDADYAYMDERAWDRYAKGPGETQETPVDDSGQETGKSEHERKTIEHLAEEVILGMWGVDPDRKNALEACGYDYQAIQSRVNELYLIAHDVIHGDYGNGAERIERLELAGYNPYVIQEIVNRLV